MAGSRTQPGNDAYVAWQVARHFGLRNDYLVTETADDSRGGFLGTRRFRDWIAGELPAIWPGPGKTTVPDRLLVIKN